MNPIVKIVVLLIRNGLVALVFPKVFGVLNIIKQIVLCPFTPLLRMIRGSRRPKRNVRPKRHIEPVLIHPIKEPEVLMLTQPTEPEALDTN